MEKTDGTPRNTGREGIEERLRARFAGAGQNEVLERIIQAVADFRVGAEAGHPDLFFSKTLPPGSLGPAVDRLRASWQGSLADFLKSANLPTMPRIGMELKRLLDNPNSTAQELSDVVLKDQKLTTAVLKLVNSPMFMFPFKVDTVTRAITVVGRKHVSHLALGAILMNIFETSPKGALLMENFWRHSLAAALIARNAAREVGKKVPERYFVAGLLHDVGQLAILHLLPEAAQAVFTLAAAERLDHFEAEKRVLGFTHAELGEALLVGWRFPAHLVSAVAFHHIPTSHLSQDVSRIVHVADVLAHALELSTFPDFYVNAVDPEAFEALELDREALDRILEDLGGQLSAILAILAP